MSQSYALNIQTVLNTEECCNCHMLFAMPADFQRRRHEEGGSFFCPQGHHQHYTETEIQKLKKELEAKQRRLDVATNDAKREMNLRLAVEKSKKKLERRIRNGVCPECHRSFVNVRRHMETKHPVAQAERNCS